MDNLVLKLDLLQILSIKNLEMLMLQVYLVIIMITQDLLIEMEVIIDLKVIQLSICFKEVFLQYTMVLNKVMVVEMILIIENNYGLISIKIMNFINLLINLFKPENLVKLGMLNMLKDIKLTIIIYFLKVKYQLLLVIMMVIIDKILPIIHIIKVKLYVIYLETMIVNKYHNLI